MIESKEILFRAKLKDWKKNPNNNKWVEGYYLKRKETTYCFTEDYERNPVKTLHYIAVDMMTDWGLPNEFRLFEIDPETLCEYTGWNDNHKIKIFENDIVEFVSSPKRSYKYLIWWNKEMSMMTAVNLDNIYFNGSDYSDGNPKFHYSDFCLMLQDPYGDFSDIKVIGNIIDNEELVKEKIKNGFYI